MSFSNLKPTFLRAADLLPIHSREDEIFYVISGNLEVLLGAKTYLAKTGDFVYIPRGTVHRFKNIGKEVAVQLVTFSPAGMEKFFEEVFPAVKDRKAAPKHGLKFLPPPDNGKR